MAKHVRFAEKPEVFIFEAQRFSKEVRVEQGAAGEGRPSPPLDKGSVARQIIKRHIIAVHGRKNNKKVKSAKTALGKLWTLIKRPFKLCMGIRKSSGESTRLGFFVRIQVKQRIQRFLTRFLEPVETVARTQTGAAVYNAFVV